MDFFNNQKKLFTTALALFLGLALIICIFPSLQSMRDYQPLPNSKPLTESEQRGKEIYISEGCIACHTQQVRNVDMDQVFGNRPSIAADYARNKRMNVWQNTANLLGSERTGPDLTNVGNRQASTDWQYTHLYNPRAVVPESVMPSYKWLFIVKPELGVHDIEVKVPEKFRAGIIGKIVASQDAKDLVAYLLSLKQTELPQSMPPKEFLYKKEVKVSASSGASTLPDGENLFNTHCASCHQSSGEGVPGAFPPLKGDKVVTGEDLELYITIIMKGYNGLAPAYGVMPPVGTTANLKPEEVAAIINHERTSWGNSGKTVTADDVKTIMDKIK